MKDTTWIELLDDDDIATPIQAIGVIFVRSLRVGARTSLLTTSSRFRWQLCDSRKGHRRIYSMRLVEGALRSANILGGIIGACLGAAGNMISVAAEDGCRHSREATSPLPTTTRSSGSLATWLVKIVAVHTDPFRAQWSLFKTCLRTMSSQ